MDDDETAPILSLENTFLLPEWNLIKERDKTQKIVN